MVGAVTSLYGQLGPKDGDEQLKKLVNQMRRNLPGPAKVIIPVGSLSLLSTGQTLAVPANATGWVTTAAFIVPDEITGAQAGAPIIRIGSNATFNDVATVQNLGAALVVDTVVPVTTLVSPAVALTDDIYFDVQTAGTGPTVLTVTAYVEGFYR